MGLDVGRSAMRKASWRLLPLIALGYAISYIDRSNISFAALQMNRELHFSAAVYGLGAGLFFVSYALFEVPSNLLLVRFGARRWIARIMLTWGVLAIAMMFVRTPVQFYTVRFLLGLAEAGFFPGVVYYLSQWFSPAERGKAISRFYVAAPLSTIVMGVVAGPLLGLQGRLGLSGWQWLFLVEGMPAVLLSAVVLVFLTDRPADAAWLSAPEKDWLAASSAREVQSHASEGAKSLLGSLVDPRVLQFAAVNFLMLGTYYAFTLSAPTILQGVTHLDNTHVGYLTAGAGLVGALAMLANGWLSDRRGERYFHLIVPLLIMAGGFGLMSVTHSALVFAVTFVACMGAYMAAAPVFWLAPSEVISPATAAASIAAINCIGQVGSFVSTYAWGLARDATGGFELGLALLPIPLVLAAAITFGLRRQRMSRRAAAVAVEQAAA